VLVLDIIEILPPLGKYKYDTWRILLVKCYIDNSDCFTKRMSLNPSLDFSQINQTSLRGVGERSQSHKDMHFHRWNQQPSKEGRGSFYTIPQNLAVGN
jgi:hypothetical protein